MDDFTYRNGRLYCEDVAISELAAEVGTPAYVYSQHTLTEHYRRFAEAFAPLNPTVCFAVKSLLNLHVLRLMAELGSGFDVTSLGELRRCLEAGADPTRIAFAGVGKTDAEIEAGLEAGIALFNVESEAEFENLSRLAKARGKRPRAALRLNPDVYDPKTHTYTVTGKKETKFGVDIDRAERFFETYAGDPNANLDALHLHIGSPIYSAAPYVRAIEKALELIDKLAAMEIPVRLLDIGGGFAADYEANASPSAADYADEIIPLLADRGLEIWAEPGRQISCNAGILVTQVQYVKQGGEKSFVIVDASMTDLVRPALYDGKHFVWPVRLAEGAEPPDRRTDFAAPDGMRVDVVGGVCESSDFLAKDRVLPPVARDDLLAVFSAGAYGFVMSSQYNARPRACEILVSGDAWRTIRRRETYEDLVACEREA